MVVIIGRELAVTGLRAASRCRWARSCPRRARQVRRRCRQYVMMTMLILEKGVPGDFVPFHLVATGVVWVTLGLTVLSARDYFYRFFLQHRGTRRW